MVFANHLSRNVGTKESKEPTCSGLDLKINDIYLNASEERCISLAQETEKELVVVLKNQIIKGWPDNKCDCPMFLRDFWSYRDKLSILDGLVLKGTRIIVPKSCKDELLKKLHDGHFGVECTKLCTRDSVYWPHINRDKIWSKAVKNVKNFGGETVRIQCCQENCLWLHGHSLNWIYLHVKMSHFC